MLILPLRLQCLKLFWSFYFLLVLVATNTIIHQLPHSLFAGPSLNVTGDCSIRLSLPDYLGQLENSMRLIQERFTAGAANVLTSNQLNFQRKPSTSQIIVVWCSKASAKKIWKGITALTPGRSAAISAWVTGNIKGMSKETRLRGQYSHVRLEMVQPAKISQKKLSSRSSKFVQITICWHVIRKSISRSEVNYWRRWHWLRIKGRAIQ